MPRFMLQTPERALTLDEMQRQAQDAVRRSLASPAGEPDDRRRPDVHPPEGRAAAR